MKSLLMIALTVFGMQAFAANPPTSCEDGSKYPEITKADLQTQIKNNSVYVIDVNGSKSFKKKHIDSAVDFETIKSDLAGKMPADKGQLVVAYCGGPACVAWKKAAIEACKAGYTNVKHFKDGLRGW